MDNAHTQHKPIAAMASTSPLAPERPSSTAPVETEEWSHDSLERIVAEIQQEFPDPAVQQASSQDSGEQPPRLRWFASSLDGSKR
jgi:hypothetical protein